MRVLGIDPGTARVGFGVVEKSTRGAVHIASGCITTSAKTDPTERLATIFTQTQQLIETYKPQLFGIEDLFYFKNQKTIIQVGQARGVLLLAATLAKIPVCSYTPLQIKQAVTGYGQADKNQVQKMVQKLLGLESIPRPDDAADGLAIAICCLHSCL
ncbi:MAG: crossover junction endodeoxyribonuclease RuvC [Candidatus Spechtbacteria bacterium]|nr:crossover junction endodeoxyribonuclease RuvC [Candidatus Spechtbacteria bacterium]